MLSSGFSALMPVYAGENPEYFREALSSIFDNHLQPSEVIVVCDGPLVPSLEKVLDEFHNRNSLRILRKPNNSGIVDSLNFGLRHVNYDFVVRCDSDDINLPHRFEKLIKKLSEGWDIIGSNVLEIDVARRVNYIKDVPLEPKEISRALRARNPFNHMSVAFRTDLIRELGGYPSIYLREDYALWAIAIAKGARVCNVFERLVHARAGLAMYRRRRGLNSALAEIKLQQLLLKSGVSSLGSALFYGGIRFFALLLPEQLLGKIYENLLRERA